MWNYEEMGHQVALKMALIDGKREPTLAQIQAGAESSVHADDRFKTTPAWKIQSDPFLGLPEHYYAADRLEKARYGIDNEVVTSQDDNDLHLPRLPFSLLNHEVKYKLLLTLRNGNKRLPSLRRLRNGTIIIASQWFPAAIAHNIEIFLHLHDKLLPCSFASSPADVIIDSPLTRNAPVRCYYLAIPTAIVEATFIDANGNVICRCDYASMSLHGSSSYQEICEAIRSQNVILNE